MICKACADAADLQRGYVDDGTLLPGEELAEDEVHPYDCGCDCAHERVDWLA